jgi:hypothetical protein
MPDDTTVPVPPTNLPPRCPGSLSTRRALCESILAGCNILWYGRVLSSQPDVAELFGDQPPDAPLDDARAAHKLIDNGQTLLVEGRLCVSHEDVDLAFADRPAGWSDAGPVLRDPDTHKWPQWPPLRQAPTTPRAEPEDAEDRVPLSFDCERYSRTCMRLTTEQVVELQAKAPQYLCTSCEQHVVQPSTSTRGHPVETCLRCGNSTQARDWRRVNHVPRLRSRPAARRRSSAISRHKSP